MDGSSRMDILLIRIEYFKTLTFQIKNQIHVKFNLFKVNVTLKNWSSGIYNYVLHFNFEKFTHQLLNFNIYYFNFRFFG